MRGGFLSVFHGDLEGLIESAQVPLIMVCPMLSWDDLWASSGRLIWCITLLITLYRSDRVIGSAGAHDRPMYAMGRSLRVDLVGSTSWGVLSWF